MPTQGKPWLPLDQFGQLCAGHCFNSSAFGCCKSCIINNMPLHMGSPGTGPNGSQTLTLGVWCVADAC